MRSQAEPGTEGATGSTGRLHLRCNRPGGGAERWGGSGVGGGSKRRDAASTIGRRVYREPHFHFDPACDSIRDGTDLVGYFQSERYFAHCAELMRCKFTFLSAIRARVAFRSAKVAQLSRSERRQNARNFRGAKGDKTARDFRGAKGDKTRTFRGAKGDNGQTVALHVRRADYVQQAHEHFVHLWADGVQLLCFSDDPAWVPRAAGGGHSLRGEWGAVCRSVPDEPLRSSDHRPFVVQLVGRPVERQSLEARDLPAALIRPSLQPQQHARSVPRRLDSHLSGRRSGER